MKKQKNSHTKFQIPNSSDQYDTFQEEVLQTTKNTSDVIQQVNNYVALIKEEIYQLRMTVEVFNADLAKQMRTLISNLKGNLKVKSTTLSNVVLIESCSMSYIILGNYHDDLI